MPSIFITGASGYIGGHTVNLIIKEHPTWNVTVLVRSNKQARIIRQRWSTIDIVVGNLEDHALISKHSGSADVVLHLALSDCSSTENVMIEAMGRGNKGHLIQNAGLCALRNNLAGYGNASDIIYEDGPTIASGAFKTEMMKYATVTPKVTLGASTSIIHLSPVYGIGSGPIRRRSTHFAHLIESILKHGNGFMVGEGRNTVDTTHIDDVASAFLILINHFLISRNDASVGSPIFYYLGAEEHSQKDVTREIVRIARDRKAIKVEAIEVLSPGEAAQIHPWAPTLWGTNCTGEANLLRHLGWRPKGPSLFDALPDMVDMEISILAEQYRNLPKTWQIDVGF